MTQPVAPGGGRMWALGGGVMEMAGRKGFGMGGDMVGYHAFFIGIPDSKIVVATLVNTHERDPIAPSMAA